MAMSNMVAQLRISRELREAELAVDEAILKQSTLLTTLIKARQDTDVAPFTGQVAMLRLSKAQSTLLSAGGELARVHSSLSQIQQDVLGYEGCPKNAPMLQTPHDHDKAAA